MTAMPLEIVQSAERYRQLIEQRHQALLNERSTWDAHWKEIAMRFCPRLGQWDDTTQGGQKRHGGIIDNAGPTALRILSSGLMAGMTSPARQWFRLGVHDPELSEYQPVRVWLDQVVKRISRVFSESNTYRMLPGIYTHLGAFGTSCSIMLPHRERVIHHYPVEIGAFCLDQDYEQRVNTIYRVVRMTVGAMIREFGLERCSPQVQLSARNGNLQEWVKVLHVIEPREDRDIRKMDALNFPFRSIYLDLAAPPGRILREGGYETFPGLCPRWMPEGMHVYGGAPAMEALGDANALQHAWIRIGQTIDYRSRPPADLPVGMKNRDTNLLPGGKNYTPRTGGANDGIRNALQIDLDVASLEWLIASLHQRIREPFFADMFLMLHMRRDDPGDKTATEVAELHDEKLLMLGPALEQQTNDLLVPLIEGTYEQLLMRGLLPPAPPEIHLETLEIEYISTLAQAQKMAGLNNVDRYVGNMLAIGQQIPSVLDNFDEDAWSRDYTSRTGIPAAMQRAKEAIAQRRMERAKSQAAQAQAEAMKTAGAGMASMAQAVDATRGMESGDVFAQPEGVL